MLGWHQNKSNHCPFPGAVQKDKRAGFSGPIWKGNREYSKFRAKLSCSGMIKGSVGMGWINNNRKVPKYR